MRETINVDFAKTIERLAERLETGGSIWGGGAGVRRVHRHKYVLSCMADETKEFNHARPAVGAYLAEVGWNVSVNLESPEFGWEAREPAVCGRCYSEKDNYGDKCEVCGCQPCSVEGCEGSHCRRCGCHTFGDCFQCDSCDLHDQPDEDPKAAARLMAWEELGACAATGLSTDHIKEKYEL